MPAIEKLALELGCKIESASVNESSKIIIVTVSGHFKSIEEMNERLIRHASIDRRVA